MHVQLAEALKFFLIVERKNWTKPVGRDVIQKLAQTGDAISVDKAAIASPVGFTKEAADVARTLEIALWVITLDERVVEYENTDGGTGLHLNLIQDDISRDWSDDPAVVHLSDWRYSRIAAFPERQNFREELHLPSHLSWARFCSLDTRWSGNPAWDVRRRLSKAIWGEDIPSTPKLRFGIGGYAGDAIILDNEPVSLE